MSIDFIEGFRIPGLGLLLLLILGLYLAGLEVSNLVGRVFLPLIENSTSKLPLIGQAYVVPPIRC